LLDLQRWLASAMSSDSASLEWADTAEHSNLPFAELVEPIKGKPSARKPEAPRAEAAKPKQQPSSTPTPPSNRGRVVFLVVLVVFLFAGVGIGVWWAASGDQPTQDTATAECTQNSDCDAGAICGPEGACASWRTEHCGIVEG